jgi:hypothetical protein
MEEKGNRQGAASQSTPNLHACLSLPPARMMRSTWRPMWRNWQTRQTQNLVPSQACGFDPLHRHHQPKSEGPDKMNPAIKSFPALLTSLFTAGMTAAATFSPAFTNGVLDSNLVASATSGFSYAVTNGTVVFSKQAGTGNGSLNISTSFQALGNFTATTHVERTDLDNVNGSDLGLYVQFTNGYASLYFYGDSWINPSMFVPPYSDAPFGYSTTVSQANLQISRQGSTLSMLYDVGSGFQTLESYTTTNLLGPVSFALTMDQAHGNTDAHSGWFSNFVVSADEFNPPPAPTLSIRISQVEVCWNTVSNVLYQLQYKSALTTNQWVPVTTNWITGDGNPFCVDEPILPNQSQGYYQILVTNAVLSQ